jgi:hypothetical protein
LLRELRNVRQDPDDRPRRWFEDDYFDLIVWYEGAQVYGFQLCYDTRGNERALTWIRGRGYSHSGMDQGDRRDGGLGRTPILVQDGLVDKIAIAEKFKAAARDIDPEVADLVYGALQELPDAPDNPNPGRRP